MVSWSSLKRAAKRNVKAVLTGGASELKGALGFQDYKDSGAAAAGERARAKADADFKDNIKKYGIDTTGKSDAQISKEIQQKKLHEQARNAKRSHYTARLTNAKDAEGQKALNRVARTAEVTWDGQDQAAREANLDLAESLDATMRGEGPSAARGESMQRSNVALTGVIGGAANARSSSGARESVLEMVEGLSSDAGKAGMRRAEEIATAAEALNTAAASGRSVDIWDAQGKLDAQKATAEVRLQATDQMLETESRVARANLDELSMAELDRQTTTSEAYNKAMFDSQENFLDQQDMINDFKESRAANKAANKATGTAILSAGGAAIGGMYGGPAGAMGGAQAGGAIGSAFLLRGETPADDGSAWSRQSYSSLLGNTGIEDPTVSGEFKAYQEGLSNFLQGLQNNPYQSEAQKDLKDATARGLGGALATLQREAQSAQSATLSGAGGVSARLLMGANEGAQSESLAGTERAAAAGLQATVLGTMQKQALEEAELSTKAQEARLGVQTRAAKGIDNSDNSTREYTQGVFKVANSAKAFNAGLDERVRQQIEHRSREAARGGNQFGLPSSTTGVDAGIAAIGAGLTIYEAGQAKQKKEENSYG